MAEGPNDGEWQVGLATHEWNAAEIQYSLALDPAYQGETPVGGCQGTEPVVAKPAPQSPALAPTPCWCPSLTPSNRRVRDPYARWCGRGGAARCPPIPIFDPLRTLGVARSNVGPCPHLRPYSGLICKGTGWTPAVPDLPAS